MPGERASPVASLWLCDLVDVFDPAAQPLAASVRRIDDLYTLLHRRGCKRLVWRFGAGTRLHRALRVLGQLLLLAASAYLFGHVGQRGHPYGALRPRVVAHCWGSGTVAQEAAKTGTLEER